MKLKQISLMTPVRGNWKYSVAFEETEPIRDNKPIEVQGQVREIVSAKENVELEDLLKMTLAEHLNALVMSDQQHKRLLIEATYEE